MEGNVATVSQSLTVNDLRTDTDPSLNNVHSSVQTVETSTTIGSLLPPPETDGVVSAGITGLLPTSCVVAPPGTIVGPCSMVAGDDTGSLPASCVVEDDEPSPSHRRSRHHYHHRHHHHASSRRRHRFCRVKWKEVNFMAAMLNIVAAVLVCTALAEPRWWSISGTPCMNHGHTARYLGVKQFFYKGFFVDHSGTSSAGQNSKYYYGSYQNEVLENCVTPQTVYVIKAIIVLCFVVIALCLLAVVFDVIVFSNHCMKAIRRHAILSVLAVCICVTINGLSYLVTQQLAQLYETHESVDLTKLDVEFSYCFYIITSAGVLCVFSVAFSLLCRRSCHVTRAWCPSVDQAGGRRQRDERLLDADFNQMCAASVGTATPISALPPPYSP